MLIEGIQKNILTNIRPCSRFNMSRMSKKDSEGLFHYVNELNTPWSHRVSAVTSEAPFTLKPNKVY